MGGEQSIPAFSRGVRLRRVDDSRTVLLVPEGIVNLNAPAAATLSLLDGARTCDDIAAALSARFSSEPAAIAADVRELIGRLAAKGWVVLRTASR
ncbi:MAG: pyrroloquinoline quinone biosynthesis peptide chaperone PqqD [Candidatus Eremiobacteraeota bacterium]|nr:pyrroloquinoline quinone biosynthesis peptide chaperone PqqD [Candidatus Eremiobacteraeota bacterium]MBV8223049.1 pyrroloquinoline quinone biosynthesis peptide chaperone PqqD [Candidatus Eremiobacteraeota bacterium]